MKVPEAFDKCVKAGGKVRTVSGPHKKMGLGEGEYVKVCFIGKGSRTRMIRGHVETKGKKKNSTLADMVEHGKA